MVGLRRIEPPPPCATYMSAWSDDAAAVNGRERPPAAAQKIGTTAALLKLSSTIWVPSPRLTISDSSCIPLPPAPPRRRAADGAAFEPERGSCPGQHIAPLASAGVRPHLATSLRSQLRPPTPLCTRRRYPRPLGRRSRPPPNRLLSPPSTPSPHAIDGPEHDASHFAHHAAHPTSLPRLAPSHLHSGARAPRRGAQVAHCRAARRFAREGSLSSHDSDLST